MKLKIFTHSDIKLSDDLKFQVSPYLKEYISKEESDDTHLTQILNKAYFDKSSFKDIPSGAPEDKQNNDSTDNKKFELKSKFDIDPIFSSKMKAIFKRHNIPVNNYILSDLAELSKEYYVSSPNKKDPVLKVLDTSTPISYWKKECPELFDYPNNMHGFKTSWELLKGIYKPNKHKTLYYNDLKEINHKLYRAIYRRNKKENFLPTHNDRVAKEVELMKSKNIKLADIKDPKAREKYRMRMQHNK